MYAAFVKFMIKIREQKSTYNYNSLKQIEFIFIKKNAPYF